jgi:hypothetical protein
MVFMDGFIIVDSGLTKMRLTQTKMRLTPATVFLLDSETSSR